MGTDRPRNVLNVHKVHIMFWILPSFLGRMPPRRTTQEASGQQAEIRRTKTGFLLLQESLCSTIRWKCYKTRKGNMSPV